MFCTVTRTTYEALLNRVAEKLLQAQARPKTRKLDYWQKVESWLKVRMHFAQI